VNQVFFEEFLGDFLDVPAELTGNTHGGHLGKRAGLNEFPEDLTISLHHRISFRMTHNRDNAFLFELQDRVAYLGEEKVVGEFEQNIVASCGLRVAGCGLRVASCGLRVRIN